VDCRTAWQKYWLAVDAVTIAERENERILDKMQRRSKNP
jgi:hypothetical protein